MGSKDPLKNLIVIVPVYNEEANLERSIRHLELSAAHTQKKYDPEIDIRAILSVNGCTDNSYDVASRLAAESYLPIEVLECSEKGMVKAQTCGLNHSNERYPPGVVIFLDADALLRKNVPQIFIEQYKRHPLLQMVGAHPLPITPPNIKIHDMIIHQALNFRAYYPKAQLSVNDVSHYHPFSACDPQPVGEEFENKSKIYIHGRCFSIRDSDVWDVPLDAVGEDMWLNLSVNTRYGPGSVRMMYNANVDFMPLDNFEHYIRTYARIHKDLNNTVSNNPQFAQVAKDQATYVSDEFLKLSPTGELAFELYKTLENVTNRQFKEGIYTSSPIEELWSYDSKGGFVR